LGLGDAIIRGGEWSNLINYSMQYPFGTEFAHFTGVYIVANFLAPSATRRITLDTHGIPCVLYDYSVDAVLCDVQ
tara:strand:- start:821 stop:1045 length:225 start_codon:yes stop_codon:yes gene_type:complete